METYNNLEIAYSTFNDNALNKAELIAQEIKEEAIAEMNDWFILI